MLQPSSRRGVLTVGLSMALWTALFACSTTNNVTNVVSEDGGGTGSDGSVQGDSSGPDNTESGASDATTDASTEGSAPDADASMDADAPDALVEPQRYGVSMAGNLERVEAGYPPGLSGAVDLTFEGWFYVRSLTANGRFFSALGASCSIAGDAAYGANQGKVNCLARYDSTAASTQRFSLAPLTLNAWHHVAWVKQGASWTLYLDGADQGSATADFAGMPAPEASSRVRFGGVGVAGESLDGVVDEARLSLSAAYNAPFAPPAHLPANGAIALALDEGAGTIVGGGQAQLQGGPSWVPVAR